LLEKKWGWFAKLISGVLVWIGLIAQSLPVENALLSILGALGLVLFSGSLFFLFGQIFSQGKQA
jgi:hypothetical protein